MGEKIDNFLKFIKNIIFEILKYKLHITLRGFFFFQYFFSIALQA